MNHLPRTKEEATRFEVARVLLDATEAVWEAMVAAGITDRELAARMGVRESAVRQMLTKKSGKLTLKLLVELLHAMDFRLELGVVGPSGSRLEAPTRIAPAGHAWAPECTPQRSM